MIDDVCSSEDLIAKTLSFWQIRTSRILTKEDARQMIENMTGFFRLLAKWDAEDRSNQSNSVGTPE